MTDVPLSYEAPAFTFPLTGDPVVVVVRRLDESHVPGDGTARTWDAEEGGTFVRMEPAGLWWLPEGLLPLTFTPWGRVVEIRVTDRIP